MGRKKAGAVEVAPAVTGPPEEVLTVVAAATLLGVHKQAIYDAIYTGRLPSEEVVGQIVVRRGDVDEYRTRLRPNKRRKTAGVEAEQEGEAGQEEQNEPDYSPGNDGANSVNGSAVA